MELSIQPKRGHLIGNCPQALADLRLDVHQGLHGGRGFGRMRWGPYLGRDCGGCRHVECGHFPKVDDTRRGQCDRHQRIHRMFDCKVVGGGWRVDVLGPHLAILRTDPLDQCVACGPLK
jgi:hypothetical protein